MARENYIPVLLAQLLRRSYHPVGFVCHFTKIPHKPESDRSHLRPVPITFPRQKFRMPVARPDHVRRVQLIS